MSICVKCGAELTPEMTSAGMCWECGWRIGEAYHGASNGDSEIINQGILDKVIVSTTNELEGYEITEYCGVVYGTEIYLVGGLMGGGLMTQEKLYGGAFKRALLHIKSRAVREHKADAIVGMKADITSPGNVNNMIVVVTGTAVKVKKKEL